MKLTSILAATLLLLAAAGLTHAGDTPPVAKKSEPSAEHRKEGEELLRAARDMTRVHYAQIGKAPKKLSERKNFDEDDTSGLYFTIADKVYVVGDAGQKAALVAEPADKVDGFAIIVFEWSSGQSDIDWYDTLQEMKDAQKDVKFEDEKATEAPKESENDALGFYKKVGNFSLTKTTMKLKMGDNWSEMPATHMRMDVTKVDGHKITYKMTTYDAEMKETYSGEQTMDLTPRERVEDGPDAPEIETTEEDVEVKAGKFNAIKYENESAGTKTTSWSYKGMVIKTTSKGDMMDMTTELQEYKLD